jgi:hypothetical protein
MSIRASSSRAPARKLRPVSQSRQFPRNGYRNECSLFLEAVPVHPRRPDVPNLGVDHLPANLVRSCFTWSRLRNAALPTRSCSRSLQIKCVILGDTPLDWRPLTYSATKAWGPRRERLECSTVQGRTMHVDGWCQKTEVTAGFGSAGKRLDIQPDMTITISAVGSAIG